ncbi:MAG TPA: carboxylate--amine ligase, partial [Dehalococcoidia bacterium]|nr:carboxylate--amine ligase [Dehalococcoidia bacterium]
VLITGAGGAPALNFINSLRVAPEPIYTIGVDCDKYALARAHSDSRHLVPRCDDPDYIMVLRQIITETGAQALFVQPDPEVAVISENRHRLGVTVFLPEKETVRICQNKYETYRRWQEAGLRVPQTLLVSNRADLARAFTEFGDIWLRPVTGAAGRGALHPQSLEEACYWLDVSQGWGRYTAARYLSPQSVTWQSIWNQGQLVVAQGRLRLYWEFADRAPSGVTGITGTGMTIADPELDELAQRAIFAVDSVPNGVFSVDFTYDDQGLPNPTEINIGRFFTTHFFFTAAGLNMPYILVKLAYGEQPPLPRQRVNPLPPDLLWVRGMDMDPVLTNVQTIERFQRELAARLAVRI